MGTGVTNGDDGRRRQYDTDAETNDTPVDTFENEKLGETRHQHIIQMQFKNIPGRTGSQDTTTFV